MTLYGGAGLRPALYEALKQLRNHDYQAADVLFISDFIIPKVNRGKSGRKSGPERGAPAPRRKSRRKSGMNATNERGAPSLRTSE